MSDRLALSNAIEDAGIERAKAGLIASTISDGGCQGFAKRFGVTLSRSEERSGGR
jgi:hypothetical protein